MLGIEKLEKAKQILHQHLSELIETIKFEPKLARIHVILRDKVEFFIRYNNHNEYSYSITFSKAELDRCRFDNYDHKWDVHSSPHHLHPRKQLEAVSSEMIGIPDKDIVQLCKLIKSGKIYKIS